MYMLVFYIQYITAYIKMTVLEKQKNLVFKFGHTFDGSKTGKTNFVNIHNTLFSSK